MTGAESFARICEDHLRAVKKAPGPKPEATHRHGVDAHSLLRAPVDQVGQLARIATELGRIVDVLLLNAGQPPIRREEPVVDEPAEDHAG